MTCYLWAVTSDLWAHPLVIKWVVTTDKYPTHSIDETWILVKEFVP